MKAKLNLLAAGMFLAATISALAGTAHYVDVNGASPTPPYTNWANAATVIQDAIDAATAGDEIVVTNGVYATGGRVVSGTTTNRVVVDKPVVLRSVNGPDVTVINGSGAVRCAYLTNHTALVGFTLTDGVVIGYGGGVYCESTSAVLCNCVLSDNSANTGYLLSAIGGGAYGGTLNNCTLTGNSAYGDGPWTPPSLGGGAGNCTLNNCTLTGNWALGAGGVYGCTLNNCIVYYNFSYGDECEEVTLNYCCIPSLDQSSSDVGNITNAPLFVDQASGNLRLQTNSPCINAGNNSYVIGTTDLDGNPRIASGIVDIGAYEFQGPAPLSVGIAATFTNVATGFSVGLTALFYGHTSANLWDFGDGIVASNLVYATHAWATPGDYAVVLWAYNESHPEGVSATQMVHVVVSPVHYVATSSINPLPPYSSWAIAATSIQDAVDAGTLPGALVLVSNGVYSTGGRVVFGTMTNRVVVDKPLTVRSVNGPQFTVIQGYQVPGTTNGDGAVRCVYLANGASLSGFTLTNGATRSAGDSTREQNGGGLWCEWTSGVVSNCLVTGNMAAGGGGGAYQSTMNDCTLNGNSAGDSGGGANGATLNNCTLSGNSASNYGGGEASSTLNNCTVSGNRAGNGGGAYQGTLNNCTLTGNSAWSVGGGAYSATLNNCIVYFNTANVGANYDSSSTLNYCCTTPQPTGGTNNIGLDPQLASASHLSVFSPCRGAGSAAYTTGTDIDGEAWMVPPSIGCDEYHAEAVTGPLSVAISAAYTNVAAGFPVGLTALIEGRASMSIWEFGDGGLALNRPYDTHAWTEPGDYVVALWAFNDTYPEGVSATVTVHVVAPPLHYVVAGSANPLSPYTSWATAARNIQDAVDAFDAATVPGARVLVTNGTYTTGGRAVYGTMTNRVAVDKPLTVGSVNGPQFTAIRGYQVPGTANGDGAIRCVYLASGASLSGFTLTKGATRGAGDSIREQSGGGLWCESLGAVVSNCTLTGNSAYSSGGGASGGTLNNCTLTFNSAGCGGGGAHQSVLNNCTLTGNSAGCGGGGAFGGTLNNCTLTGNSSYDAGGAFEGTLNNCTLIGNSATDQGGGASGGTLNNCTLTDNSGGWLGGGASSCRLNNCTLSGNSADNGGGAGACTLNNCTLTANSATSSGGGAWGFEAYPGSCTLNNCTLTGNSAGDSGGGAYSATLNNCIVYFNTAKNAANYASLSILTYCCTTPQPSGAGNITLDPLFVNRAGGNLRLQSNSPCINAGNNAYVIGTTDLDGNPRIVGGTVDIGAYECQSPALLAYFTWLQSYSLPTDAGALYADSDGDGLNNWQEWRCGTCPTNSLSVLEMLGVSNAVSGVTVSWQSVAGVNYILECSTNLSATQCFTSVAMNLPGQPGKTTYTDTNATGAGPFFYRVGVGN